MVKVSGFKNFRWSLDELERTGAFNSIINALKGTTLLTIEDDTFSLPEEVYSVSVPYLNDLNNSYKAFVEFLEHNFPEPEGESIRIKLPETEDFDELEKTANLLKHALSTPLKLPEINGSLRIIRGEPGSVWLLVGIGGLIAMKLIAELCWAAAVVRKKKLEGDFLAQQVRELEMNVDQKEVVFEAQKVYINKLIESEGEALLTKMDLPEGHIKSITHAIICLEEIFKKGGEVHPSLTTSESVANLFPSNSNFHILESHIKQLGDRTNSESNI